MNKNIQIIASAFIKKGDNFLIVKRASDETFLPNKWELPGGKSEVEENPNDTVVREIQEECGVGIRIIKPAVIKSYISDEKDVHYIELFYIAVLKNIDQNILLSEEHSDFSWITMRELEKYKSEMTPYIVQTIEEIFKTTN